METKSCNGCDRDLPLAMFGRRSYANPKPLARCKDCRAQSGRKYADGAARKKYATVYEKRLAELRSKQPAPSEAARERARAHYAENRHRRWASLYKSRAQSYDLPVVIESFTEDDMIAYWGNGRRCIYCDGPFDEIDHMIPVSIGGTHVLGNVVPACRTCNSKVKPVVGQIRSCEFCRAAMPHNPYGRTRRYCSTACRQKGYRARHAVTIPAEMRDRDRWMRYRLVPRGDKVTKVPTQLNGRPAKSTDARTWASYADAEASKVGAGLGFALGEGVACIDLDDAIVDGRVQPWAQAILDRAPDTFVEVSQSGEGLHIFGLLPEGPGRNLRSSGQTVEVYSAGRFIAVTGRRHAASPPRLANLEGLVSSLL